MGQTEGGPLQDRLYNLHRSTGGLILPRAIIRLLYRLTHPPLPLPEMPALQRLAAESVHAALFHHFVRKDRVLMRMISGG